MYYWPIYHFYVETRSLKKFISVNKLLFARHYHLIPSDLCAFAWPAVLCVPSKKNITQPEQKKKE